MQQYPSYEEYKKTDLEWLGEIPKHWEVKRIKYVFKEINERSNNGLEDLLSVSQYTGVTLRKEKVADTEMLLTNAISLVGYKLVKKNDLVINIMLAWNGSLGISNYDGIVSPAYGIYRLKNKNCDTRYFDYLFRTKLYKSEFRKKSTGVIESRLRLYTDSFFRINAILPPISEQQIIAQFLDHKTQQIQQFISKKQQHIQLLQEHKAAIINKAVTKGIDSNVAVKDSGIDWLGEIPTHWEVKKLKYFCKIIPGQSPNEKTYNDKGIGRILINGPVEYGKGVLGYTVSKKWTTEPKKIVPKNTLLFCMRGSTTGKLNITHTEVSIGRGVSGLIAKSNQSYLNYAVLALTSNIQATFRGSTFPSITSVELGNYSIAYPTDDSEQELIIEYVKSKWNNINKLITKIQQQIQLIEEYQQSLIAQAVTGKIDVRGIAN